MAWLGAGLVGLVGVVLGALLTSRQQHRSWVRDHRLSVYSDALEQLRQLIVLWGTDLRSVRFSDQVERESYVELAAQFTQMLSTFEASLAQISLLGHHARGVGKAYWDVIEPVVRSLGDAGVTTEEWDLVGRLLTWPYSTLQRSARNDLGLGRRRSNAETEISPLGLIRQTVEHQSRGRSDA
jgi:hypothetical protein